MSNRLIRLVNRFSEDPKCVVERAESTAESEDDRAADDEQQERRSAAR